MDERSVALSSVALDPVFTPPDLLTGSNDKPSLMDLLTDPEHWLPKNYCRKTQPQSSYEKSDYIEKAVPGISIPFTYFQGMKHEPHRSFGSLFQRAPTLFGGSVLGPGGALGERANWIQRLNRIVKLYPSFKEMTCKSRNDIAVLSDLCIFKTFMPVIYDSETAHFFLIGITRYLSVRGQKYVSMNFDETFELLKSITRRYLVTLEGLTAVDKWLCAGFERNPSTFQKGINSIAFRIRTLTFSLYRHADTFSHESSSEHYLDVLMPDAHPRVIVRLSSSPKAPHLKSRYRQQFGGDSILSVSYSFTRMGLRTQLFVHNNEAMLSDITETELWGNVGYRMRQEFILKHCNQNLTSDLRDLTFLEKEQKYHLLCLEKYEQEYRESRVMNELIGKPFEIAGCKFEALCQNTSGMHSYRYTYFSKDLSLKDTCGVEDVKSWAIPRDLNPELFQPNNELKYVLRLSLLNTPVIPTVNVGNVEVIEDEGDFTDGCGFISPQLASEIYQYILNNNEQLGSQKNYMSEEAKYTPNAINTYDDEDEGDIKTSDYVPSAFQIRLGGAKGMLVQNPHVEGVVLRKSMVKFQTQDTQNSLHSNIQIVGYSKPAKHAKLNACIIYLLSGCGKEKVELRLMSLWQDHVTDVLKTFISSQDETNIKSSAVVDHYIKDGDFISLNMLGLLKNESLAFLAGPFRNQLLGLKLPIEKARRLYGVADPLGVLREGEVFVNITLGNGTVTTLSNQVVVTKEPCLHRGDLRKLNCVDREDLRYLRDVIVFPVAGNRSIPNMITGSDLDGDQYLVCWDDEIVSSVTQYEPGNFDNENVMEENELRDFEPDVFKDWIGVRHAYADHFGSSWCEEEPWKVMSRLSDIVNLAVDAPKKGKTFRAINKEDIDIIEHFPKYPHFHRQKVSYAVKRSTSLLGHMYDWMMETVTSTLSFSKVDNESSTIITATDDREYMLTENMFKLFRASKRESVSAMIQFISDKLKLLRSHNISIQYASEFLNIYWRLLCLNALNYEYFYICALKTSLENISSIAARQLKEFYSVNTHSFLVTQGLYENQLKQRKVDYEILESVSDDTCCFYKLKVSGRNFFFFLLHELFFDATARLSRDVGMNLYTHFSFEKGTFDPETPYKAPGLDSVSQRNDFQPRHSLQSVVQDVFLTSSERISFNSANAVGLLYKNGKIFPQDYWRALNWLCIYPFVGMAKTGFLQLTPSFLHDELQVERVMFALKQIAISGFSDAQYNLGRIFYYKRRLFNACFWLKQSATQFKETTFSKRAKPSMAYETLGKMYRHGWVVSSCQNTSTEYLKKSAENKNIHAMYCLGEIYEACNDWSQACYWFEMCAKQGIYRNAMNGYVLRDGKPQEFDDEYRIDELVLPEPLQVIYLKNITHDNVIIELDSSMFSKQLCFPLQSKSPLYESSILNEECRRLLIQSVRPISNNLETNTNSSMYDRWKMIYKGSRDGFRESVYNYKCVKETSNRNPILVVVKSTNGDILGGFTNACWKVINAFIDDIYDRHAFTFLIEASFKKLHTFEVLSHRKAKRIRKNFILDFGDIRVYNYCEITNAETNWRLNYRVPSEIFERLGGIRPFKVHEIEVFQCPFPEGEYSFSKYRQYDLTQDISIPSCIGFNEPIRQCIYRYPRERIASPELTTRVQVVCALLDHKDIHHILGNISYELEEDFDFINDLFMFYSVRDEEK